MTERQAPNGFRRVNAKGRPSSRVGYVQCLFCGRVIQGSGLGIGSHRRSTKCGHGTREGSFALDEATLDSIKRGEQPPIKPPLPGHHSPLHVNGWLVDTKVTRRHSDSWDVFAIVGIDDPLPCGVLKKIRDEGDGDPYGIPEGRWLWQVRSTDGSLLDVESTRRGAVELLVRHVVGGIYR